MSATQKNHPNANALCQSIRALKNDRFSFVCLCFLIVCALSCFCAPIIAPYAYEVQNLAESCKPPNAQHIFGTDMLGRDVFSRILYGGRISFAVGLLATAVAAFIGVSYGMISGMAGGRVDSLMMRFVDAVYSLPFTIFVILLTLVFGRSIWLIFVAIGAVEWLTTARIARGLTLELKSKQFVEAATALGQSKFKIITRHILPNAASSILVCATLTVPSVMLLEAFLSFLGLGVQAPLPSWGSLVKDGAEYMEDAPWTLIFPAIFFSATLFALNRVGETLSRRNSK